jgi:hypothetical protein
MLPPLITVLNLSINKIVYGSYPVITCTGSYVNSVIAVGKDQLSNSVSPTSLSLFGTTINIGDETTSLYTVNIKGGAVNITSGDDINLIGGASFGIATLSANNVILTGTTDVKIGYSSTYFVTFNNSKHKRRYTRFANE